MNIHTYKIEARLCLGLGYAEITEFTNIIRQDKNFFLQMQRLMYKKC